jgi:peptidoglycan-associated lipoprotein
MKLRKLLNLVAVAVVIASVGAGCKKMPVNTTPIDGQGLNRYPGSENPAGMLDSNKSNPINSNPNPISVNPQPVADTGNSKENVPIGDTSKWTPAAEQPFAADTIYFEFDKSNVGPGEVSKITRVANAMKNYPGKGLRIEGHCDERGTEEYNRALGERRALSIREHLVRLGVDARQTDTISYGEDRPKVPGHNEAAWKQNRRGEFILMNTGGNP